MSMEEISVMQSFTPKYSGKEIDETINKLGVNREMTGQNESHFNTKYKAKHSMHWAKATEKFDNQINLVSFGDN